jgi:predicted unusual protein kinase regulating ubiquinone biosynthesis (AarF/ABC1/UbiB family)
MPPRGKAFGQVLKVARRTVRDAVRGYRRRHRSSDGTLPTDADARRAELARMGTNIGARVAGAKLRAVGRSTARKREIRSEVEMRTAAEVFEVMGNMKGAVMKIAQMASFVLPDMPEDMAQQLAQLQAAAPPMSYGLVKDVVTEELGAPPESIFADFEEHPMAAASIGQVHHARTKDGADVAVKVQYPGVDEAIIADLKNADMLFETVAAMFGGFNPKELLAELVSRMTEEFDYRREADNQRHFADRYRGHRFVKIPEVIADHSATRVITTEFVAGRRFYDVLSEPQESRNTYGEIISRFANGSVVVDGVFTADPHPGNYIFMDDGRICFLDFGLIKRLTPDERALVRAPGLAILHGDPDELIASLRSLGVIPEGTELDRDKVWEFFTRMLGPVATDGPYRYTREDIAEIFREVAMPNGPYRETQEKFRFPAMLMMWQRYTFGTSAVLGHLEAEANWRAIASEHLLDHEPSTEIGKSW